MGTQILDGATHEVLSTALRGSSGAVLAATSSPVILENLVDVANQSESAVPTVRLLGLNTMLKDVRADFLVASAIADLVDRASWCVRAASDPTDNSLLISENRVVVLVNVDAHIAGLATDDADFVEEVRTKYSNLWEEAAEFRLRTPPLTRIHESFREEFGPTVDADLRSVLASLETVRGGDELDEVTICLLVAAKNEELLYDVSKWGEDVGIASRASFSRTKQQLENLGLIGTEKVPMDIGRPRQRLVLRNEHLEEASTDELASVAGALLS